LPGSGSTELSDGSIAPQESDLLKETSGTPGKNPGTGIEFRKDKDNDPESNLESKPESRAESELPESEPEKEIRKLSELGVKGKPGKETPGKAGKLPEEKPARSTELTGKTGKAGQKKGKGKTAVLRQYNLGDYL